MPENRIAVLVMSCDKYQDIWPYFFHYFWKAWPDCPYPLFLGSTNVVLDDHRVKTVLSFTDNSWSDSAASYLGGIEAKYVLLMQEDFFLERPVDAKEIEICLDAMEQLGAHYCRLLPDGARLNEIYGGRWNNFGWIDSTNPYRISTQISIWLKESLLEHLRSGESPWDFEIMGSERTRSSEIGYMSSRWAMFKYDGHGALVRGRWTRRGHRMACETGLAKPGHLREVTSIFGNIQFRIKQFVFWSLMRMLPSMIRQWNLKRNCV